MKVHTFGYKSTDPVILLIINKKYQIFFFLLEKNNFLVINYNGINTRSNN